MTSAGDVAAAGLWVATFEGPYHCDPRDPGGATAWGVSARYHPKLADQLKYMTVQQAAAILAQEYWPDGADALPSIIAIPLLAFAVLEGPLIAAQALQRSLGVSVDGVIGPNTVAATVSIKAPDLLLNFFRECMEHLHGKAGWALNGTGWECRQFSASLAATGYT